MLAGAAESSGALAAANRMKVIFLDIDGVLNCKRTPNPRKLPYIVDKKLLSRFRELVLSTRAKVVLTSTWRIDPIGRYAAKYWGIPFLDVCPDMPKKARRQEILAWIAKHPRVTRFCVIDDEDDGLDGLPLFQPSAAAGLDSKMARAIEKYLAGETEETIRANALVRVGQNIHSLFKRGKS